MSDAYRQALAAGIARQDLALDDATLDRLLAYHALLVKWNKAYNLTSVRDPGEMIGRHLLDSLSILSYVGEDDLLDVGTGPGLPGMVLALVRPGQSVTLLDSNGKKTRFLIQVKMELGVDNAEVVHNRLEFWQPGRSYAQISSRAFATLADMVAKSAHLLAPGGRFLAMKGQFPQDEIDDLPDGFHVDRVQVLTVPGTAGARHLVELSAGSSQGL
ncbi:16S rRNA (guanine(527)-N(7))-methyltransferase RsmG [Saccharospirillum salsuginis]|uniref:Ribosomal RNA small subunit methyltransferase G n=1 Tax=Saccharospirillum salsuginis TaxID=418750 RepID=A0A918NGB9_9GAMM|nr:16S rRNA (guanine(527)-N(7))-methyltransferase RsmG [Saccharospirillum salsuginis]GGX71035.1 ribosomal RNA small subunit methyltransferase G [Saccharospirillum salsuginis]